MKFDYVDNITKYITNRIMNNESIFFKHFIPKLFYDKQTMKLHSGINQIYLAEKNFTALTVTLDYLYRNKLAIPVDNPSVILLRKNKKLNLEYIYKYKEYTEEKNVNQKVKYDFSNLKDIAENYFSCAFSKKPYIPQFTKTEKNSFLENIKKNPYEFSRTFNIVLKDMVKEYEIYS